MNINDQLIKARVQLLLDKCFYGNLALHLPLKEEDSVETFATDGKHIFYNKKFAESLSNINQQFIICHELLHNVFYHLTRVGDRNKERWSLAVDYATNAILHTDFGFVPEGGLYDSRFENMTAEEIYNKLPDMNGKGGKKGYRRYSDKGMTIEIDDKGDMKINGQPVKKYDEHRDATGTKEEIDEMEKDWKVQVSKAYQQAKIIGKLPAGMEIFIKTLLEPKLDWLTLMKQFIISNAQSDYRWLPPNRRHIHDDMYMPSMTDESLGDVAFIVDNSGSTIEEQQRFFSECNSLLQQYEMSLHLIGCDAEINSYKVYSKGDKLDLKEKGGGGTDMRVAFNFIKEKRINPTVIVCLTDGYTPFPEKEEYPTLWVLSKDGVDLSHIPFGLKVKIE